MLKITTTAYTTREATVTGPRRRKASSAIAKPGRGTRCELSNTHPTVHRPDGEPLVLESVGNGPFLVAY